LLFRLLSDDGIDIDESDDDLLDLGLIFIFYNLKYNPTLQSLSRSHSYKHSGQL